MIVFLHDQLFLQAWELGDQTSVVGLDFQGQNATVSTNPTVFGSNMNLVLSPLLICFLEAWPEWSLNSTLSD